MASVSGRETEFREGVERAKEYVAATGVKRVHMMSGHNDPADPVANATYRANCAMPPRRSGQWGADPARTDQRPRHARLFHERLQPRRSDHPGDGQPACGSAVRHVPPPNPPRRRDHGASRAVPAGSAYSIASVPSRNEPSGEELNYPFLYEELDRLGYAGFVGCEYRPPCRHLGGAKLVRAVAARTVRPSAQDAQTPRRKVLLIALDQWRADATSIAGGGPLTPNLDALAAEGVSFRRHYTCAAPCGPARATLLTGLYPFIHRSVRNATPLDARFSNLALEARKGGIDPVLFGYTDSAVDPRTVAPREPALRTYEGVLPGFRLEAAHNEASLEPWLTDLANRGYDIPARLRNIYHHPRHPQGKWSGSRADPLSIKPKDSDTAWLTDKVLDHWRLRRAEDWFVHLVWYRPHPPFIAPEPYNTMVPAPLTTIPSGPKAWRTSERCIHSSMLAPRARYGGLSQDAGERTAGHGRRNPGNAGGLSRPHC